MSLYEELGGDEAVVAALDTFYGKVLNDDEFAPFFKGVNMDRLKGKQRKFFAMALGGPNEYDGRDLRAAHERPRSMGLDGERFERFMAHFRATLQELQVPGPKIDEVMDIV